MHDPTSRSISGVVGALLLIVACSRGPALDQNHDGRLVVACVGDSNTSRLGGPLWCERLGERARPPGWEPCNMSQPGARIVNDGATWHDRPLWGGWYLRAALERCRPDVVILALGTNDLMMRSAEETLPAFVDAVATIEAEHVLPLVALVPPFQASPSGLAARNAEVERLNRLLEARFPGRTVDFFSAMTQGDYDPDGVHLNDRGQEKRAEAAWAALRRLR